VPSSRAEMQRASAGLKTKSDRIRALAKVGCSRQQIADFLGLSYQHVHSVLAYAERKRKPRAAEMAEPRSPWHSEPPSVPGKIRVGPDGSAVIPASVFSSAGFREGDSVVARVVGEGDVRLLSSRAAMHLAQKLVRQFVPENVSLVDELIKERHREAENE
jgi:antitoxin component of MazEF toxin-antitoxin module